MIVRLSPKWLCNATETAIARHRWAMERKAEPFGRDSPTPFQDTVLGCVAECAVAKAIGTFWDRTIGNLKIPDVGGWIDVRSRRFPGTGTDLIIYPKDPDERPFVHTHVVLDDWSVVVIGWLWAHEAKPRGKFYEPSGIYYVGPDYRPIDELIALDKARKAQVSA